MAVKRTVLAYIRDSNLIAPTSNLVQESGLKVLIIENDRELPNYFENGDSPTVFLDILKNINCEYPVIIFSDCKEKTLFPIQRIGVSKRLSFYALQLNEVNGSSLHDLMSQNHNQILPLTRMPDETYD